MYKRGDFVIPTKNSMSGVPATSYIKYMKDHHDLYMIVESVKGDTVSCYVGKHAIEARIIHQFDVNALRYYNMIQKKVEI